MKENSYQAYKVNELSLRQHRLLIEYNSLKQYCPSGIYVLPHIANINIWRGVIFLRQGFFKDATFRFRIEIPSDYPCSAPVILFTDYIFHPLINAETGELAIGPAFPEWRPEKDFIFSLLGYMKMIFYSTEQWTITKYLKNPQALQVFLDDPKLFLKEAISCAIESTSLEDQNPANSQIHFQRFNAVHFAILKKIKQCKDHADEFLQFFKENFI